MIEEMQTFMTFSFFERRSICLLLDFAKPKSPFTTEFLSYWRERSDDAHSLWSEAILIATWQQLGQTARIKEVLLAKTWESDYEFHSEALRTGVFVISNGYLKRFEPFYFLFIRLFSVSAHPHIPSIYAATMLHSSIKSANNDADEILAAMEYRDAGWRAKSPSFFPRWTDV